jgi:two-component system, OmpR family, torCAD operon response regulator TorR
VTELGQTGGLGGSGRDRLLIVEDDPVTRGLIAGYFTDHGFSVEEAESGRDCRRALKRQKADLIFLDIMLPDCDGIDLAREIQGASGAGIIFITRRDSAVDRILGLEMAGDHYVTKPVDLRDLLARARSLLRRRALNRKAGRPQSTVTFGGYVLDQLRRELARIDGEVVRLTRAEFDLLAALVAADGRPLSRDYLIEVVSNRHAEVDARTVDALIARLRRKLVAGASSPLIVTVGGIGYKLGVETDEAG